MWIIGSVASALIAGAVISQHMPFADPSEASFAAAPQPIHFELFRGNRIFFKGTVNGKPAEIMLDSGAASSVADSKFAASIGLTGGSPISVRGAGGDAQGRMASGVTIVAGPLTLAKANVLLLDMRDIQTAIGRPIDLILGRNAFTAGIVDIDFERREIRFAPSAGFVPPKGAVRLPMGSEHGIRLIPVSIGQGAPIQAAVDLGNGGTFMIAKSQWENDAAIPALRFARTQAGGVGGLTDHRMVTLPGLTVAGQRLENVPASLNLNGGDLPTSGANIGIGLLQRFRLAFDYGHDALYLTPIRAALARPMPKDRLGMRFELAGDRLRAAYVSPDSPAAAAGWRTGDMIVSVNGAPITARFFDTPYGTASRLPAGTKLDLVRADGTHLPVVLKDYF
jgi:hypothetical protein